VNTIQWSDQYNIGIQRIDYQHHYFVELINWLSSKLQHGQNAGLRGRYVEEIMRYASFHFFSEETQMLEAGYPELERHQGLHRNLISELTKTASRLEMGETDTTELIRFLTGWFLGHTAEEDAKVERFFGTKT